jgi:hypothetical protein
MDYDELKKNLKIFENDEIKFSALTEEKWDAFQMENKHAKNDRWLKLAPDVVNVADDAVNSPGHYTTGRYEAIDIIEDAIMEAPSTKHGFLQGQVLKYLLRLWHKIDAKEDAEKARWYLTRLIDSL